MFRNRDYLCPECGAKREVFREESDTSAVVCGCGARMRRLPAIPLAIVTDKRFVSFWGLDDGFGDYDTPRRRRALEIAKKAGVSTTGKTFVPEICAPGKPFDPQAWVPHEVARSYIRKRVRELGYVAHGRGIDYEPEPEEPKPYRVNPRLVEEEVEEINQREYEGRLDEKRKQDLREATAERLKGDIR